VKKRISAFGYTEQYGKPQRFVNPSIGRTLSPTPTLSANKIEPYSKTPSKKRA